MADKKHSAQGKVPENGMSFLEKTTEDTKQLGLDSHGPNQMPMGIVKKSISTSKGKFEFA
mgnify:FL=1|jgi:hypothetical protein